jgi:hypothetical protein
LTKAKTIEPNPIFAGAFGERIDEIKNMKLSRKIDDAEKKTPLSIQCRQTKEN